MSTGDQADIGGRLSALLPGQWWDQDANPVRDAILAGLANGWAFIYSALQYARGQTRIGTASEGFLDIISQDYFGGALPREANESDAHFRMRILLSLLRPAATRGAMANALLELTGRAPLIVEPWRTDDCGGYDSPNIGYDVAGCYGSYEMPGQAFITAYRPAGQGIPNVGGYDCGAGGYDEGAVEWVTPDMTVGVVTDADIEACVNAAKPEGTLAWLEILS